jgi:hypothetical protein
MSGGDEMGDQGILDPINELAHEQHEIWSREARGEGSGADHHRLRRIEVMLDQLWDLLHQRRALRTAGLNPDEAAMRDERTVESYRG